MVNKFGTHIKNGVIYSSGGASGGGNANIVTLTRAEYDALPEDKLSDGIVYLITDEGAEGGGNANIIAGTSADIEEALPHIPDGATVIITDDYNNNVLNTIQDCIESDNLNDVAGAKVINELNQKIENNSLPDDILTLDDALSLEEIAASTEEVLNNTVPKSSAVKTLNQNLGGLNFRVNNNQLEWKATGADTWSPFSHGIYIGDKYDVKLTGSHNITIPATVCYTTKNKICLLGDNSLEKANWTSQCNYSWNYSVNINGKVYTGTCRIPTLQQIYSECAGYKRDFQYWTSTKYSDSRAWRVYIEGNVTDNGATTEIGTLPFIEIIL